MIIFTPCFDYFIVYFCCIFSPSKAEFLFETIACWLLCIGRSCFYNRSRCITLYTSVLTSIYLFFFLIQAAEGEEPYICRIEEMFEGVDGRLYFTARWFYRACDTVSISIYSSLPFRFWRVELSDVLAFVNFQVIERHGELINEKRLFFSEIRDINELNCLLKKLNILMIPLTVCS